MGNPHLRIPKTLCIPPLLPTSYGTPANQTNSAPHPPLHFLTRMCSLEDKVCLVLMPASSSGASFFAS